MNYTEHKTTADNADIIAAAIHAARPIKGKERGSFPRFMVMDGDACDNFKSAKALAANISTVSLGTSCYVFRNAGYGATITFDRPA